LASAIKFSGSGRRGDWRNTLRDQFAARRHSALLAALIAAFAVRPLIGGGPAGYVGFSVALLILLLIALHNINVDELIGEREKLLVQSRRQRHIGWALVGAAFVERVAVVLARSRTVEMTGAIAWFLLLAFVTWNTLRSVLKQKAVTSETISMSISVYLLLGFTWSLLYVVIFLLQPDAFSIAGVVSGHAAVQTSIFATFGYFSLITLSTVGYGDIAPLSMQARFATAAEGIAGQFYLAILVARLVGMQMSQGSNRPENQNPE
jgi:Ion channel